MSEEILWGPGWLRPGARLAGYLLEEQVGRGGMTVVYRAGNGRLGRRVALKVLAPALARDPSFRRRFLDESRAAAAVGHPHILPVFDAGEADGLLYLAMLYVPGGDVRMLLDRAAPLPVARACGLLAQVASALHAAHARGLVHRDVKPTNMLLGLSTTGSQRDYVYLSDFGLAQPSGAASGRLGETGRFSPAAGQFNGAAGQFAGEADYAAPEQIQGLPVNGRADQYSLACVAFEMLCGNPPFRREHPMASRSAHLADPPPSLTACRPELPAAADEAMATALAKSPADRYPSCLEFAQALLAACGIGVSEAGIPPVGVTPPAQTPPAPAAETPGTASTRLMPVAGTRGTQAAGTAPSAQTPAEAGQPTEIIGPVALTGLAGEADPEPGRSGGPLTDPDAAQVVPRRGASASTVPFLRQPGGREPVWWASMSPPMPRPGSPAPAGVSGPNLPPFPGSARRPGPRRRGPAVAVLLGVLVVLAMAAAAYLLLRGGSGHPQAAPPAPSPAMSATASATPSASPRPSPRPSPAHHGPAATVRAYFHAINHQDYARAWHLGGRYTGSSYSAFVTGFQGTAHDTVRIMSVSGNIVTARIAARQTDGSVHTYQGTYQVSHGVITQFHVVQIS